MTELAQRVRHKFAIRNTNGYALSALLDGDTPLEIFRRLIVGSEGTLAFLAEAVIDTIPAPAATTVSWIALPSIGEAAALVPGLVAPRRRGGGAHARPRAGCRRAGLPRHPGVLAGSRSRTPRRSWWSSAPTARPPSTPRRPRSPAWSQPRTCSSRWNSPATRTRSSLYWKVRDGLLGIVGKQRPAGTALIIEDVCFPPDRVAEGARDLQDLLTKHGFLPNAAGHAAYGNLHFTLTPGSATRETGTDTRPSWPNSSRWSSTSTTAR